MLDRKKLDAAAAAAAAKLDLTQTQVDLLQSCARGIYEDVAGDLEPDFKRSNCCRRSTVLEVVLDAGRLEQEVRRRAGLSNGRGKVDPDEREPLVAACRAQDLIEDIVGPAFPYGRYEVGNQ